MNKLNRSAREPDPEIRSLKRATVRQTDQEKNLKGAKTEDGGGEGLGSCVWDVENTLNDIAA